MESLVGVDVSNPSHGRLIQQHRLDGSLCPTETIDDLAGPDFRSFWSKINQKSAVEIFLIPGQVDSSESPRIHEPEPDVLRNPVSEGPGDVTVGWNGPSIPWYLQTTGHSQPDHGRRAVVEPKEKLLSTSIDRVQPRVDPEARRIDRPPSSSQDITHHIPSSDPHPNQVESTDHGIKSSSNGFDFGKFGHGIGADRIGEGRDYTRLDVRNRRGIPPVRSRYTAFFAGSGTRMSTSPLHQEDPVAAAEAVREMADRIRNEVGKVIVGQEEVLEEVLLAIFCGGHAIIEGVPGLAKTLLVHTLSRTLGLDFSRIQFTPDLMPSDMTGTEVIEEDKATGRRELRFVSGPIFSNIILADEINRTPPKTQGALLEAMQERQVTVGGETHTLPEPFFVLATQNPIEQEGTYPLPEAQLDRFMFNIRIGYPTERDELDIVQRTTTDIDTKVEKVVDAADCLRIQRLVRHVPVADHVARYALRLVRSTRVRESKDDKPEMVRNYLAWGAGPRASQFLVLAAKARALVTGAPHVTPELVRDVALPVMRHRIIVNFNAEADGVSTDDVVRGLLETTPVDDADGSTRQTLDSVTR